MVGVGIIGCGLIGRKRAEHLPAGMRLASCFDVSTGSAEALVDSVGAGPQVIAGSVDELLQRSDVELVVIATVHNVLPSLALQAVEAGKHVLIEKPGATTSRSLRDVRDAAAARKRCVRVGFNHRFHPALLMVREVVLSSRFGNLLFVRARYGHGGRLGYEQEWRADPIRSGGGELVDQASHLIDLIRSFFGDVDLAFAELPTLFWNMRVDDNAFVALRPRSGGFAWLHASWTEWKNLFSFEVTLERAKLEVTGLGGSYGPERLTIYEMAPELGPPSTRNQEYPAGDPSWRLELGDVAAAIEGRPTIGASVDDAIEVLTLIEEAYGQ